MASKLLLEYFFLHVYFLLDGLYSFTSEKSTSMLPFNKDSETLSDVLNKYQACDQCTSNIRRLTWTLPETFKESFHLEILKESLVRAVHDIDATFSKEAFKKNLDAGSTATIVLMVDRQILVANVGDSKAFLCSEQFMSHQVYKHAFLKLRRQRRRNGFVSPVKKGCNTELAVPYDAAKHFSVKELTTDHHPDRYDERLRVEAAGGYVVDWSGIPRVNGELAVSRAIGDVSFKSYGVTSTPEVTDWQPLTTNDSYLVVASDGIIEKQTTQDVCDLLWNVHIHGNENLEPFSACMDSLAECVVTSAFEKGSMDNMAAVVVPLRVTGCFGFLANNGCEGKGRFGSPITDLRMINSVKPANALGSSLLPMEYVSQATDNFNRLWVEGNHGKLGFFYLYENLSESRAFAIESQKDDWQDKVLDLQLSATGGGHHSSLLDLYHTQNLCLNFGMDVEGERGQCINLETFARFIGMLASIPGVDSSENSSETFPNNAPSSRYVLRRRFGRGSFGEVWLAFHWYRCQGANAMTCIEKYKNCALTSSSLDVHESGSNLHSNSSAPHCHANSSTDDFFILKRILVERGTAVYLSGLREKYFGEMFLNASMSLGSSSDNVSYPVSEVKFNVYNLFNSNQTSQPQIDYMQMNLKAGLKHIARYVESFESRSKEMWLVFQNEGISLSKLLYTTERTDNNTDKDDNEHVLLLQPSSWWHWLRTTEIGKKEMCNLIWQLLLALKSCHDRNVTHRDIKPENMVICFEDETGRCWKGNLIGDQQFTLNMRIIDFGSGVDEFTIKHLYGSHGPSSSEQTYEYTPPEALLNPRWFEGPTIARVKYDMWSVGVVVLELILGSPHVFQINARTRALLDQQLDGWGEATKELAFKLRSLMELCILIPGSSSKRHRVGNTEEQSKAWLASWKCSEEFFSDQVKKRDPLKIGFPNVWAMRLVRQLLTWDPEERLSVDEALQHPYFEDLRQNLNHG
ncbi:hypothetical protein Syun_029368 [Stephania yunnanensis]|uniref:Uncharacterized protein n=1 Tax=Stephania yunnanensis TaxID=152371 RepID=A0AAP0E5G3_9MAGN